MITLVVVRHAKSDWSTGLADHDRPLNERGRRAAPAVAQRLADTGFRPDRILSSTAVRARDTAQALSTALGVPVEQDPDLYGASAETLWAKAAATGARSVVVVAHDPGISVLAERLSGGAITHMSTAAVATFRWDVNDWDAAASRPPDAFDHSEAPR